MGAETRSKVVAVEPAVETKGPERSCLGCGSKRSKGALHRLVLDRTHQLVIDAAQTAPGRGAYLCGAGCLKAAFKRKAFQRAFRGLMQSLDMTSLEEHLQP